MTFTTKKRGADNYLTDQNWDAEDNADEEVYSKNLKLVFY